MRDGELMDTKDPLLPEDGIIDKGYIGDHLGSSSSLALQESACTSLHDEGAHPRLEGEAARQPIHCVRDGKDWKMTMEILKTAELANDIEV